MAKAKKPPLGSGERFAALKEKIAARGGVRNPAAVAAAIGRKKYGAKRMAQMSAAGRRRGESGGRVGRTTRSGSGDSGY